MTTDQNSRPPNRHQFDSTTSPPFWTEGRSLPNMAREKAKVRGRAHQDKQDDGH